METVTPTELAVSLWGQAEGHSRSAGARRIRKIARDLYGASGQPWHFTPRQVAEITDRL